MNWIYQLWFGYAWPSDKGNGPEALQQTLVYAAIAMLLYPPIRNWFIGHFRAIKDHITKGHQELHAKLDHLHRQNQAIMDHHGITMPEGETSGIETKGSRK